VTNQSVSGLEQTVEVAHEALISNWGTLRAWVNEDRKFLLWRERLGTLLGAWEGAQESEEALLRGPLLKESEEWFKQRSEDLSNKERKFITTSRKLRPGKIIGRVVQAVGAVAGGVVVGGHVGVSAGGSAFLGALGTGAVVTGTVLGAVTGTVVGVAVGAVAGQAVVSGTRFLRSKIPDLVSKIQQRRRH
jgi:hypothetical protein